ncbi:hypothetical protein B0F90DRAFT_1667281 [Multifurca ochricompacta]|uniref:Uncharacterized protein n=1 Tax=Multifurca ochricompacta TaxID=376703 RepID=A0AAD4M5P1_9AGAM|nr:hypothetical protein B0F90DRAFT_1667281 [Multifurca ochricompacta]
MDYRKDISGGALITSIVTSGGVNIGLNSVDQIHRSTLIQAGAHVVKPPHANGMLGFVPSYHNIFWISTSSQSFFSSSQQFIKLGLRHIEAGIRRKVPKFKWTAKPAEPLLMENVDKDSRNAYTWAYIELLLGKQKNRLPVLRERRVGLVSSLRKREKKEKIMASSAQPTRLSKLSFPRYITSFATTPHVRLALALHILRTARGSHVSDHPHDNAQARSPLWSGQWIAPELPLPSPVLPAILTAGNRCDSQSATRTTLTTSKEPQFKGARRAWTCGYVQRGICQGRQCLRVTGTAPKRKTRFHNGSKGGGRWKSVYYGHYPDTGGGSSQTDCMTKEGDVLRDCRSAPAAASHLPEPRRHQRLLNPRAPICKGWGRSWGWENVPAAVPRSGSRLPQGPPPSDARVQGHLKAKRHPHTPSDHAVARPLSFLLHTSLCVPVHSTESSNNLLIPYPFATKPCGLSNVFQRFQAPVLAPLQQPPVTERSRGSEAAHGEQIQQKVPKNTDMYPLAHLKMITWRIAKTWGVTRKLRSHEGNRRESIKYQGPEAKAKEVERAYSSNPISLFRRQSNASTNPTRVEPGGEKWTERECSGMELVGYKRQTDSRKVIEGW